MVADVNDFTYLCGERMLEFEQKADKMPNLPAKTENGASEWAKRADKRN